MTPGLGIFLSTVLILLAATIYQISVREKWKLVGKVVGVLVLIGVVVGGGVWGWIVYSRPSYTPYVVDELANVRLGMPPVEVSLARGEPQSKDEPTLGKNDKWKALWRYQEGKGWLVVQFSGSTADELTVFAIVEHGGWGRLLTLGRGDSEQDVIKKLGEPTSEI